MLPSWNDTCVTCLSRLKEPQQWGSAFQQLETYKIYEDSDAKDNEKSTSKSKPKESSYTDISIRKFNKIKHLRCSTNEK